MLSTVYYVPKLSPVNMTLPCLFITQPEFWITNLRSSCFKVTSFTRIQRFFFTRLRANSFHLLNLHPQTVMWNPAVLSLIRTWGYAMSLHRNASQMRGTTEEKKELFTHLSIAKSLEFHYRVCHENTCIVSQNHYDRFTMPPYKQRHLYRLLSLAAQNALAAPS